MQRYNKIGKHQNILPKNLQISERPRIFAAEIPLGWDIPKHKPPQGGFIFELEYYGKEKIFWLSPKILEGTEAPDPIAPS